MPRKKTKLDAAVFVNLIDGVPEFLDNEGNKSEPGKQEEFGTKVADTGRGQMFWFAGAGVDKIEIVIDSDPDNVVQRLRSKNDGQYWKINVKSCNPGCEFKYSIIITPDGGGEVIVVDPKGQTGGWPS